MENSQINQLDTQALSRYLAAHIDDLGRITSAEKFAGGQSNPTFLLTTTNKKLVLRRKPPGKLLKSAHAVDREFKVLTALANTSVPVAEAYHLCEDDAVIGSMFYVMQYVDGRVFWDPRLPELGNQQRAQVYDQMNQVLVDLHSIDIQACGLGDYGRPGNYFERQISRWTSQYRASETEQLPIMEALVDWVQQHMPADDGKVALVHGDYRLDNIMFAHDQLQAIALMDWELSTLGHPYADLAYQCMQLRLGNNPQMPGLAESDRSALGIPSEQAYVEQYCQRMGISNIPHWDFYLAFSFFRLAAILQGVKKRAIDGNSSSSRAREMGELIGPLLAAADQLIA